MKHQYQNICMNLKQEENLFWPGTFTVGPPMESDHSRQPSLPLELQLDELQRPETELNDQQMSFIQKIAAMATFITPDHKDYDTIIELNKIALDTFLQARKSLILNPENNPPYRRTFEEKINNKPKKTTWEKIKKAKKSDQLKTVPVYTLVNEYNEIPKVQSYNINKAIGRFYKYIDGSTSKRSQIIKNLSNNKELKKFSLVFFNKEDAEFYRQNMGVQRANAVRKYGTSVCKTTLDKLCHKVNYKSGKDPYFVVPDILELGKLLTKHQYKNTLHHKQSCDQSRFHGIPIYIFKKSLSIGDKLIAPVFFKFEDALLTWTNYRVKQNMETLTKNPELIVYNFESFLNEQYLENSEKYQILPPHGSYKWCKENIISRGENISVGQRIVNTVVPKFKFLYDLL